MNIIKFIIILILIANLISGGEINFTVTILSSVAITLTVIIYSAWFILLDKEKRDKFIIECSERPRSKSILIGADLLAIGLLFFFNEFYFACVCTNLLWLWENNIHISVKKHLTSDKY